MESRAPRWSCLFCWLLAWRFQSWGYFSYVYVYVCRSIVLFAGFAITCRLSWNCQRCGNAVHIFLFFFLLCALSTNPCTSQRFSLLSLLLCFCFFLRFCQLLHVEENTTSTLFCFVAAFALTFSCVSLLHNSLDGITVMMDMIFFRNRDVCWETGWMMFSRYSHLSTT